MVEAELAFCTDLDQLFNLMEQLIRHERNPYVFFYSRILKFFALVPLLLFHYFASFNCVYTAHHRSRINTEEKATMVVAVWGTDFFKIPCPASYHFVLIDLKNRMNLSFSSNQLKSSWCNSSYSSNRASAK